MNKYRLMLCRDANAECGCSSYALFKGLETLGSMLRGVWQDRSKCRRLCRWSPEEFHKQYPIRLKPGDGPRVVTLEFADKE